MLFVNVVIKPLVLLMMILLCHADDNNLMTACTFTVNEVTGEGTESLSFSLSDLAFENCDGGSVNVIGVSITNNCGDDAQTESSKLSIYDGDENTDFTCVWNGTSIVDRPEIRLVFNPTSLYGYDIVAGPGERIYSWTIVCEGLMELSDTQTQVAAAMTAQDNDKYSQQGFEGVFSGNNCVDTTSTEDPGVSGDPFITTMNGVRRQFWLPKIGEWTSLLHSKTLDLSARAFALPGTYNQWIDGLRLTDIATNKTVLSIEIPFDSPLGSIGNSGNEYPEKGADLDFLRVFLEGIPLNHIMSEVTSADGTIAIQAAKLAAKTIMGRPADSLWVRALDFAFHVYISAAAKFDDPHTNEALSHLNFKFTSLPRDGSIAGFFADVVLAADDAQLTSLSKSFLTRPSQPYPTDAS